MDKKEKWFEFVTSILTRLLFANPVRKAGFIMLRAGFTLLTVPFLLVVFVQWWGIGDFTLGTWEIVVAVLCVIMGLILIIGEYVWSGRPPPRDQILLNALREQLPREMVDFVRDHQFHNGFYRGKVKGVFEIADKWRNTETHFVDSELQRWLKSLIGAAQRFTLIVRQELRPIDPGSEFMLIRRPEDGPGHDRPYSEVGKDLLANAHQISESYDAIMKRAIELNLQVTELYQSFS